MYRRRPHIQLNSAYTFLKINIPMASAESCRLPIRASSTACYYSSVAETRRWRSKSAVKQTPTPANGKVNNSSTAVVTDMLSLTLRPSSAGAPTTTTTAISSSYDDDRKFRISTHVAAATHTTMSLFLFRHRSPDRPSERTQTATAWRDVTVPTPPRTPRVVRC